MSESNDKINQTTNGLLTLLSKYSAELEDMDGGCYGPYDFRLIPYSTVDGEKEMIYMNQLVYTDYIDVVYVSGNKKGNVFRTYNAWDCVEAFENNVINSPISPNKLN